MEKDNMDLISVVFGYDKPLTRNKESVELLRYGMSNYKVEKVLKKGEVLESFEHILFKDKVEVKIKEDVNHLSKKKTIIANFNINMSMILKVILVK